MKEWSHQIGDERVGSDVVFVTNLELRVEENLLKASQEKRCSAGSFAWTDLRCGDCPSGNDEDLGVDVGSGGTGVLRVLEQVLDNCRSNDVLLLDLWDQLEPSDTMVREQAEALAALRVAINVLQDGVCSVPIDVGGVRKSMAGKRERLEKAIGGLVRVLERLQDERVSDGVVERMLGGADELFRGVVKTLPLLIVLLFILYDARQLELTMKTRSGTCPVRLIQTSALALGEETVIAPYRHASDTPSDSLGREVTRDALFRVLAIGHGRLGEAE